MGTVKSTKYYIEDPDGINDVSEPYACFHYGIKWIPEAIAGYKHANGYIVQKVQITAPDFLTGYPCKKYYEAWTVEDGAVKYCEPVYQQEDDVFKYSPEGAAESLFRFGTIKYLTDVFWIDKKSAAYKIVDLWKPKTVWQAGNLLKSSETFAESVTLTPVHIREPFVFSFDFRDETEIFNVIVERGRNTYSCDRRCERINFINEYEPYFIENNKEELFAKILVKLKHEYGE